MALVSGHSQRLSVIGSSAPVSEFRTHQSFGTPTIVERTNDYMRVEYKSKVFGFVDDVEFWFPPDDETRRSRVEYRSASRVGESDLDANRKRIKCLRQAFAPEGWKSVGFS